MNYGLSKLEGKILTGVTYDPGQVTFHTTVGDYVYNAYGDCCSRTYIDSVEGPSQGKIFSVEAVDSREDEQSDYTVIRFHKVMLVIEGKGHLDIEFRNESNGYYDGYLELVSAPEPFNKYDD